MPVSPRSPFQYSIIRVVPRVERGERFNAGVILFCRPRRFLDARVKLDAQMLRALAPDLDPADVEGHLQALAAVAAGDPQAGPVARLEQSERFHWLVAPSSTILQPAPVHTGLCTDPAERLERLFTDLVLPVAAKATG